MSGDPDDPKPRTRITLIPAPHLPGLDLEPEEPETPAPPRPESVNERAAPIRDAPEVPAVPPLAATSLPPSQPATPPVQAERTTTPAQSEPAPDIFAAARSALENARQTRGDRAPEPLAAPLDVTDPFGAARAALEKASAVRGVTASKPPPSLVDDPMGAALEALDRARAARSMPPQTAEEKLQKVLAEAKLRRIKRTLDDGEDDA